MKRIALVLSFLILGAASAVAQTAPETATLTAEGTGIVTTRPDIVIISIGVATRAESPAAALDANSRDMQAVIDAVIAAGVSDADIQTSGFSINPVYADRRYDSDEPAEIVGFAVSNEVTVRIRDLDNSGAVIDEVVAAGANQINSIRFDISEPGPLRDEAMVAAIADARRKAELMAEAAGVELVRILSVSAYAGGQPQFEYARVASAPIVAGEQAISANATVIYEIAPR